MKANFLPDNDITATTLDEIFLPSKTGKDEYLIRKSLLQNLDGDILNTILVHANKESEVGFYMGLYVRDDCDDPIYRIHMGHKLPQWLAEEIAVYYTITIIP